MKQVIVIPAAAAEIMVFMTILLGLLSSSEIFMAAPAFMNKLVIKITRVPETSSEMLEAKKVLFEFCLYILKIRTIYLLVRFLN